MFSFRTRSKKLTSGSNVVAKEASMDSDSLVEALAPFGNVRVYQHSSGQFSATLSLFVSGMKAEVNSGYNHATMNSALRTLHERCMGLLAGATKSYDIEEQTP